MQTPLRRELTGTLRSRNVARTFWRATLQYDADELDGSIRHADAYLSLRPHPSWQFSIAPAWEQEINPRQYVTTRAGGRPEAYGSRYIFAFIDRTTLSAQARLNYTFKPDMNLDVYMEPFAASGRYYDFGELLAARSRLLRVYGTSGTQVETAADGSRVVRDGADVFTLSNRDFNIRSLRSNVVLRWEWRPGSTLFVVWQQNRMSSVPTGEHVGARDLFGSFSAQGVNVLAIKTTFWLSR